MACEEFPVISHLAEQSVVSCHEPLSWRRSVPADLLVGADDMAYKEVTFGQVPEYGIFMVGVRLVISA